MKLHSLPNALRGLWIDLRTGLWFVPALFVVSGVALAIAAVYAETLVPRRATTEWPLLFGGGAEGSRGMLAAIAGSMITVAGVAFSITIVALSLASSQYTPRVLRNFMRDRTNQVVLGVFVGVFAYCLVVLRSIRAGEEDDGFLPSIAVWLGLALAFVAIAFFVYFIHHIALSIQAEHILSAVRRETLQAIDRLFPDTPCEDAASEDRAPASPAAAAGGWQAVPSRRTGYVQQIDLDALARCAREHGVVIRMDRGVGEFVIGDLGLLSVAHPADAAGCPPRLDGDVAERLRDAYLIDRQRSVDQDPAFGIRQIVDVALKALSPGVNDTTTAVMCVDHLTAILARLARRRIDPHHCFDDGRLLVLGSGPEFEDFLDQALQQIRQNAEGNVAALTSLVWSIETLADVTASRRRRRALLRHVEAVRETAERTIASDTDGAGLAVRIARVRQGLEALIAGDRGR